MLRGALRRGSPIKNHRGLIPTRLTLVRPFSSGSTAKNSPLTQNDVQMVSMLYRTHKSLQPQSKVPSLYAFDALARAARSHALKHGFSGDAPTGNSATFLLKLEAILEGLFQDVVGSGVSEVKVSINIWQLISLSTPWENFLC